MPKSLVFLVLAYILIFMTISVLKYYSFSYSSDLAIFSQVVWASSQGDFFYTSRSYVKDNNFLGDHVNPILLLIAPLYRILPYPLLLIFLQTVAFALGAFVVYYIAKNRFYDDGISVTFSLLYLLYPAVGSINLFNFHPDAFSTLFLLCMFYFFEKKDFKKFFLFMLLTLMCQENMPLVVSMFGVYALIMRREKKWVITPIVVSVLWFYLCVNLVIPHFAEAGYRYYGRYTNLGGTPREMVETVITKPIFVLGEIFTLRKMIYACLLFAPVCFISLAAPEILIIALLIFVQNFITNYEPQYNINFHYTAPLIPFIFISAIYGAHRLRKVISPKKLVPVLLASTLIINAALFIFYNPNYEIGKIQMDEWNALNKIPENASVYVDHSVAPALSNRYNLGIFRLFPSPAEPEYIMVDKTGKWPDTPTYLQEIEKLKANENLDVVFSNNCYILFKRK